MEDIDSLMHIAGPSIVIGGIIGGLAGYLYAPEESDKKVWAVTGALIGSVAFTAAVIAASISPQGQAAVLGVFVLANIAVDAYKNGFEHALKENIIPIMSVALLFLRRR